MDKKIEFTPKQLTELQTFFQQNDFTANMTLVREYDFDSEQSEIFVRTKRIFGEYWLGNLRPLGVNRKMKNFSKDYEVPLVSMAVCMFSCFKCFKTQSSSCSCKVASPPRKGNASARKKHWHAAFALCQQLGRGNHFAGVPAYALGV